MSSPSHARRAGLTLCRLGAATMLIDRFVEWAFARGCTEAHVDHYAANAAAGALYELRGFEVRSVSRALRWPSNR